MDDNIFDLNDDLRGEKKPATTPAQNTRGGVTFERSVSADSTPGGGMRGGKGPRQALLNKTNYLFCAVFVLVQVLIAAVTYNPTMLYENSTIIECQNCTCPIQAEKLKNVCDSHKYFDGDNNYSHESEDEYIESLIADSDLTSKTFVYESRALAIESDAGRLTRVAVTLSGFMKAYLATYPNIKQYVFDVVHPDVFIVTGVPMWVKTKLQGMRFIRQVMALYRPRSMIIQHRNGLLNEIGDIFGSVDDMRARWPGYVANVGQQKDIRNHPAQWIRIQMANELKKSWENEHKFTYDAVIRLRADVALYQRFKLPDPFVENAIYWTTSIGSFREKLIIDPAGEVEPSDDMLNHAQAPLDQLPDNVYVMDQLGFGSSRVMDIYSSLNSSLDFMHNFTVYNDRGWLPYPPLRPPYCPDPNTIDKSGCSNHFNEGYLSLWLQYNKVQTVFLPSWVYDLCWSEVCTPFPYPSEALGQGHISACIIPCVNHMEYVNQPPDPDQP